MNDDPRHRSSQWQRWILAALALSVGLAAQAFAQPQAAPTGDTPYVVEYHRTLGLADEFADFRQPLAAREVRQLAASGISAVGAPRQRGRRWTTG
jgi:hypothetical protein